MDDVWRAIHATVEHARQIFAEYAQSKELCPAKQCDNGCQEREAWQTSSSKVNNHYINKYANPKQGHHKTDPTREPQRLGAIAHQNQQGHINQSCKVVI